MYANVFFAHKTPYLSHQETSDITCSLSGCTDKLASLLSVLCFLIIPELCRKTTA